MIFSCTSNKKYTTYTKLLCRGNEQIRIDNNNEYKMQLQQLEQQQRALRIIIFINLDYYCCYFEITK